MNVVLPPAREPEEWTVDPPARRANLIVCAEVRLGAAAACARVAASRRIPS